MVEQVDRDAAESFFEGPCTEEMLATLFANHRIEHQRKLIDALRPFANCVDQIDDDESDGEWAKFRLLIKDYRRAKAALNGGQHE